MAIHWNKKNIQNISIVLGSPKEVSKKKSQIFCAKTPHSEKRDFLQDAMVESEGEKNIP